MLKDEPIHLRGRSCEALAGLWTSMHAKPIELSPVLAEAHGDYVKIDRLEPTNPSSLRFKGLCDLKLDGSLLYVVDRDLDLVACYNLSLLYDGDADWSIRLARLQETMQGRGGAADKACFHNPCAIAADGRRVYVADGGNHAVKVYTRDFDYIRSIRDASFLGRTVDDMEVNPHPCTIGETAIPAGSVWVLSHTTNHVYLSILSDGLVAYNTEVAHIDLAGGNGPRPAPLCLAFSRADSQYLYLATSGAVYKLYACRPSEPFATFEYGDPGVDVDERLWQFTEAQWSKAGFPWSSDVTDALSSARLWTRGFCLCCADSADPCEVQAGDPVTRVSAAVEGDIVLHTVLQYNPRRVARALAERETDDFDDLDAETVRGLMDGAALLLYREPSRYDSLLDAERTPCFTAADIGGIGEDEYVNAPTFNRLMYKVAYNTVRLKGIVRYRMRAYYGADHLLHADGVEPAPKADLLRSYSWHNFFIGDNEPVSVVVNRALLAIWDVQNAILQTLRTREIVKPSRQKDVLMLN